MQASDDATELVVRRDKQTCSVYRLEQGNCVLIGSGDVCGITIRDNSLSPIHCAVRREGAEYWVEDWNSQLGVFVDDQRIDTERQVSKANRIRIGEYQIEIGELSPSTECPKSEGRLESDSVPENDVQRSDGRLPATVVRPSVVQQTEILMDVAGGADNETVDLLRAEIEQLNYEIAERDAQLVELTSIAEESGADDEPDDALLGRLEDLLTELESNDERSFMLERLLQSAEEKIRADQDERQHLSAWIDDIELRLGEREGEWRAECDALAHRVESLLAERDELMQQLATSPRQFESEDDGAPETSPHDQSIELRRQLHESEERRVQLEKEIRDREIQLTTRSEAETALREEHLKLAQERAALAREQAELATVRASQERTTDRPETEIDCRLREFRQHLREIHVQEQQTPRKLSSRIKDIWARLDRMG